MPLELLDVIDTAVKVGLGAAISGIATYQVTRLNHKSDKNKELAKRRVELLTFSIEKLEIYFEAYSRCYARLSGILRNGTPAGPFPAEKFKYYKELDDDLIKTRGNRAIASSRLRLIGQMEAADLVDKINGAEKKLRDLVIFEKQIPSREELESIKTEFNNIRNSLFALLALAFEKSYG